MNKDDPEVPLHWLRDKKIAQLFKNLMEGPKELWNKRATFLNSRTNPFSLVETIPPFLMNEVFIKKSILIDLTRVIGHIHCMIKKKFRLPQC